MTTWSLCPFFNELDVLEIRLRTLDKVVDRFVVAEATRTYKGAEKPLHLAENRQRFSEWWDRIEYVVVDDMPAGDEDVLPNTPFTAAPSARWVRENHQRDALLRGMPDLAPNDLVHLSDCDEIPSPTTFPAARERVLGPLREGYVWRPGLSMHVMYLNWRWREAIVVINRFMAGRTLTTLGGPQAARLVTGEFAHPGYGMPSQFGWHLAYMGGPEAIAYKIQQAAHAELDRPEFTDLELIRGRMATGHDLFDRPERNSERVPLRELPPPVQLNPDAYRHLMIGAAPRAAA